MAVAPVAGVVGTAVAPATAQAAAISATQFVLTYRDHPNGAQAGAMPVS